MALARNRLNYSAEYSTAKLYSKVVHGSCTSERFSSVVGELFGVIERDKLHANLLLTETRHRQMCLVCASTSSTPGEP